MSDETMPTQDDRLAQFARLEEQDRDRGLQPAFLPDMETGVASEPRMQIARLLEQDALYGPGGSPSGWLWPEPIAQGSDPDLYICPRTYKPAVSLLEARTERRPMPWRWWLLLVLPVVVAAVWRWL